MRKFPKWRKKHMKKAMFLAIMTVFMISTTVCWGEIPECKTCACYAELTSNIKAYFQEESGKVVVASEQELEKLQKDNELFLEKIIEHWSIVNDACPAGNDRNIKPRRLAKSNLAWIEQGIRSRGFFYWNLPKCYQHKLGIAPPPAPCPPADSIASQQGQ